MKFLSFCLLAISNFCLASGDVNLNAIDKPLSTDSCMQSSKAIAEDFNGVSSELKKILLSSRYCLQTKDSATQIAANSLPDAQTILNILKRYKNEYAQLETDEQKIALADAFLTAASYQFSISYENIERAKPMTIVFKRATKGGAITGHALSLFQQDHFDKDKEKAFISYISDSDSKKNGVNKDMLKRIQYILNGKQSKLTEQVVKYTQKFRDDDEEEQDNRYEEEDQEYRDWAEEQAAGWGDVDFWWDGDENEEWLVIVDDEMNVDHAYHFVPKAG